MIESIYIPIMIASVRFSPSFFYKLGASIWKFETPQDVSINQVYDASDLLTDHLMDMVRRDNHDPNLDNFHIVDEDVSLLKIDFETTHPLRHQRLPWLEKQIKAVVRQYDNTVALYFFYLLSNSTFHAENIAKVFTETDTKIVEDPIEDDMTALYEMAAFLDFLWYRHPEEEIAEHFPYLTAKTLLLFG
ncbi:MAG: hypothetical protein PQJ35_00710 [Sphaerochaetaceae bacterium]|nr:hypothetical protein [Sphaerochaetaceae bacterium]